MADAEEIEQRVAALESQVQGQPVQRSERDATAARVLAGGADRDVGEIRAEIRDFRDQNNRVLNAMCSDLTDVVGTLREHTERPNALNARLDGLAERTAGGFAQVRGALDASAAGQAHIVGLLDQLLRRDN